MFSIASGTSYKNVESGLKWNYTLSLVDTIRVHEKSHKNHQSQTQSVRAFNLRAKYLDAGLAKWQLREKLTGSF